MSSHLKEVVMDIIERKREKKLNSGEESRIRAAERNLDNKKVEIDEALIDIIREFRLDRHDIEETKKRVN